MFVIDSALREFSRTCLVCVDADNVLVLWVSSVDRSPCSVNSTTYTWQPLGPVPWKSWHIPHEWPADDSECLEKPGRNHNASARLIMYVCSLCWFVAPPYSHTPGGQYFLRSSSGLQPLVAYRGYSSVSKSLGDISWYFLSTLRHTRVTPQSFTFLQVWHFLI